MLVSSLTSTLAGYAVLMISAALTYLVLAAFHIVDAKTFLEGDALHHVREPSAILLTIGAAGAVAGIVIESAYRRSVIAGALVALSIIEAASAAGVAGALGYHGRSTVTPCDRWGLYLCGWRSGVRRQAAVRPPPGATALTLKGTTDGHPTARPLRTRSDP